MAFGSLLLAFALAGAGGRPAPAAPLPVATPNPTPTPPFERVLIAVLDADALAREPTPALLASRLLVTDPTATPVVMVLGGPPRTIGSFDITLEPTTTDDAADDPGTTIRVSVEDGPTLVTHVSANSAGPAGPAGPAEATVVEFLAGRSGIVAHREGSLDLTPDELRVPTWRLPSANADAVALDDTWWTLGPARTAAAPPAAAIDRVRGRLVRDPVSRMRRLVDVSVGDVTGDGARDVALSFRRPFRRTLLNASSPRRTWTDAAGLSAHVGLYRATDLSEIWVAGTLVRPVRRLAACTGALAVAYSTLRSGRIMATSAWRWQGFAFLPLPELPGGGSPICVDVDRDGRSEPAIVERS